jgi:hypothetical protein
VLKVNPLRVVELAEKLILALLVAPKVAVPVWVLLPGTTFGIQFALALKSKLPSAGLVTVGMPTQVASCAKTGDVHAKAPIRLAAIAAAARFTTRLNCTDMATFPNAPSSNPSRPPPRNHWIPMSDSQDSMAEILLTRHNMISNMIVARLKTFRCCASVSAVRVGG